MGLFSSKKDDKKAELPPLEFPELKSDFPSYESQDSKEMPAEEAEIKTAVTQPATGMEQPLFIKLEQYKDVVESLKKLKSKMAEAESVLERLNDLKQQEDRELENWKSDLETVRKSLLGIDKKLFEA